ncbi:MAG: GNAT family N-acetyltransferase [Candidatus Eremiobacteraeota bacterium]|nr:GNAT family N-acetyltransferase [Candidatus Eremiobacteraeota bacterium]
MMRLHEISADAYVRDVLPLTAPLWARGRDWTTYASQTLELARSGFGKRHYRTMALHDGGEAVASFKRYERTVRSGTRRLRALGFGAVFTPEPLRGRGYASAMIAMAMDVAKADGYELAFLYSDVRPHFYAELGFVELPSREILLRADALPSERLPVSVLTERDWSGVRRCFDLCEHHRAAGFQRTPLYWEWLRVRLRHYATVESSQPAYLVVRHGRGVGAYVLGERDVDRDTYELAEFGFADAAAAQTIPALLRAAAGDLRRIAGWLPPSGARELLPKGTVRRRRNAIFMVAPLSKAGTEALHLLQAAREADACWSTDHI